MKSLVIGASGLVGSHVSDTLDSLGPVTGTAFSRNGGSLIGLDIRDAEAVTRTVASVGPDVVVCAAAEPHVDLCEREPERTREINVDGTRNVVAAARAIDSTLVFFSSDYVFDGKNGPYDETDAVGPVNEYGRQKVRAEAIVSGYPKSVILRTSGVFGADDRRKNFVYQVIDRLRAGMLVTAAADQTLCPTWAGALADALAGLLTAGFRGTCNVAGPQAMTRAEFAILVADAFGLDGSLVRAVPTVELPTVAPRPARSSLTDALLRSTLGRGLPPVQEALAALRAQGL